MGEPKYDFSAASFSGAIVNIGSDLAGVTQVIYQLIPPRPVDAAERVAAYDRLAALPLDILPDPAPLPSASRMPFSRNPLFVGRTDDLTALAAALKGGGTAVAVGLGGCGKTQLATEVVHRYGQYFAGGVFWVSCADVGAVMTEIAACGSIGLIDRPDFGDLKLDRQVSLVLAAWQSELPRLLVFDNCEDEALLSTCRPPAGGCSVLITSRRVTWDPTLGVDARPLGVLPRTESIALLRKHRPDLGVDDPDLAAIAAKLGDLPLALHLAGSYLARYQRVITPAAYLARLRDPAMLAHPSLQGHGLTRSPTGHDVHVGRTFAASYGRLDAADPTDTLALTLLARSAYFAPGEPIPHDLLRLTIVAPADDPEEAAVLVEDSLIRLIDVGLLERVGGDALRLHRLLAAFVHDTVTDETAQMAVEYAMIYGASDVKGLPAPLPALHVHLRHITDVAKGRADERAAHLCHALGTLLFGLGDLVGARAYLQQARDIGEAQLGADNRWVDLFRRAFDNVDTVLRMQEQAAAELRREGEAAVAAALASGSSEDRLALAQKLEADAQMLAAGELEGAPFLAAAAYLRDLAANLAG